MSDRPHAPTALPLIKSQRNLLNTSLHGITGGLRVLKEEISYLIIVQQDVIYAVYYISAGSSTCVGCWHLSSGARTTV